MVFRTGVPIGGCHIKINERPLYESEGLTRLKRHGSDS